MEGIFIMTKHRYLTMTAAAVCALSFAAPAAKADDMNASMMESFMGSIQQGMNEVQSWFTPAPDGMTMGDVDAMAANTAIEIPPQFIEPAAGDASPVMMEEAVTHTMDAVTETMDEAVEAVTEAPVEEMAAEAAPEMPETPAMERIQAQGMKAHEAVVEEVAEQAAPAMEEAVEAVAEVEETMPEAVEAVEEVAAEATPTPIEDAIHQAEPAAGDVAHPTEDAVMDAVKDAVEDIKDDHSSVAPMMDETLSQTGEAFQVEDSVSAFNDPMMTPDQLNAIQSAAGDVVDEVVEDAGNMATEQVEGLISDFAVE